MFSRGNVRRRQKVVLLASTVVLASCGQLFGIQERDYTPVPDSGAVLDARSEDAGLPTMDAPPSTNDVAEAATDVVEASTNDVVEAGCTPCVLASSTIGNCCVQ